MGAVNPARTDIDSPWVQLVAATAEEIYGRQAGDSAQHARHRPLVRLRRDAWNSHLDERGRSPFP